MIFSHEYAFVYYITVVFILQLVFYTKEKETFCSFCQLRKEYSSIHRNMQQIQCRKSGGRCIGRRSFLAKSTGQLHLLFTLVFNWLCPFLSMSRERGEKSATQGGHPRCLPWETIHLICAPFRYTAKWNGAERSRSDGWPSCRRSDGQLGISPIQPKAGS